MIALIETPEALAAELTRRGAAITAPSEARVVIAGRPDEEALAAAIAAGACYLDLVDDQAWARDAYERHEAAARRAGACAISGLTAAAALADLAAAHAAAALDADEDDPLDELLTFHVHDGGERDALTRPAVMWRHDRWDPCAPGAERRRVNAGPELGGERDAISFASAEVITIPRHVPARRIQSFVSFSRGGVAEKVAWLASPALPWLRGMLGGAPAPAGSDFAVIAIARRRFDEAQVRIAGRDPEATTTAIAAWAALALARDPAPPAGVLAPSEVFDPAPALAALADEAALTVTTSFGR